jgi:hypothetical protein
LGCEIERGVGRHYYALPETLCRGHSPHLWLLGISVSCDNASSAHSPL